MPERPTNKELVAMIIPALVISFIAFWGLVAVIYKVMG